MKYLNNDIINLSGIARLLEITLTAVKLKIKGEKYHKFSEEQKSKIKDAIKQLYEQSQRVEWSITSQRLWRIFLFSKKYGIKSHVINFIFIMEIAYKDEYITLYHCDCREVYKLNTKFDMCFADPPFAMDLSDFKFIYDFDNLIKGHTFLMNNARAISKEIVENDIYFRRMFAIDTVVPNMINSSTPMEQVDFVAEFRKLGKGNGKFNNLKDGFTTLIRSNKNRHLKNTSQNFDKGYKLFREFILHYTNENDIILDPFSGSGKLLKAARIFKRKAIGFEVNDNSIKSAKELLMQRELF